MASCNKCIYKGQKKYTVAGCFLFSCKKKGEVPFWTNKEYLLDKVDCKQYTDIKSSYQLEFNFDDGDNS